MKGAPTAPLPYETERVFGDHQFVQPVVLTSAPGTNSMFLQEHKGKIFELTSENASKPILIGDLSEHAERFQVVYGLDFHPDFETNREIYVCYKRTGDREIGTVVSRLRLTDTQPMQIVPGSEEILYTWLSGGHNGGCVKFGPDGCLYVTAGDSEAPFPPDPLKAGQDLSNLLSTVVRIDVNGRSDNLPYRIPADNPFVDLAGARPEIYAYGFRNPWRMAFDRETGDLWLGDVGWELWEMIYLVQSSGNYGWSIVEGPHSVDKDGKQGPTPILKPAASHSHAEARSITGGQVYYGERLPKLRGAYIYGDHVTGRIWTLRKKGDSFEGPTEIARAPLQIICFGLHHNGEVYVVDYLGSVHRLVGRENEDANDAFPKTLSQSGLFSNTQAHDLVSGVLPYSVIAEPWMDGATGERFVGIPNQEQIGTYKQSSGHGNWDGKHRGSWKFPRNSVLGKTISLEGRRVETQLLHYDGQAWQPYSYIWNAEQTDAKLADDRTQTIEFDLKGTKRHWQITNRGDCMICHSNANDMILGFKPNQLRRPIANHADQLDYLASLGLFEDEPRNQERLSDPTDESNSLESRARTYLHLNCAHCHRRNGGGAVAMDVVFGIPADRAGMINELPAQGSFGIKDARVVAPGDPYRSVLLYRFCKLGPGHMPKLGGLEVDQHGARLLHDWILDMGENVGKTNGEKSAGKELAGAVRSMEAATDEQLVEQLSSIRQTMLATQAIRAGVTTPTMRERLLSVSSRLPGPAKDVFESFVPVDQRTERLGANIDVELLLSKKGDAGRGRALFLGESLSCKTCHAMEAGAESVGPNLASLKADRYRPVSLLENILHPSKEISEAYRTHVVQTVNGELFSGVAKAMGDSLVLRDAQNKTHTIKLEDIEFRKVSDVSIMPEKLLETLTLAQARDLLEFLSSLQEK